MKRETENILKTTLTEALDIWWENLEIPEVLPYLGENAIELMASAAVAVLLAIADAQEYLYQEGMIKEEEDDH